MLSTNLTYVSITSQDNVSSRISVFRHEQTTNPVIVFTPAMGRKASFYRMLAKHFLAAGFHVVTADLRGHGESKARVKEGAKFGYYEMIHYDLSAVLNKVQELFPQSSVILLGHSLGGQLSLLYSSLNPEIVKALILIAPGPLYFKDWPLPKRYKILLQTQCIRAISEILGYFPGRKLGFAGTEAREMVRDWTRIARTGKFRIARFPRNFENTLNKIELPLLALSFQNDPYAPKEGVQNFCQGLKQCPVTHWHIPAEELGLKQVNHFNWVMNSALLVQKITPWIKEAV